MTSFFKLLAVLEITTSFINNQFSILNSLLILSRILISLHYVYSTAQILFIVVVIGAIFLPKFIEATHTKLYFKWT